YLHTMAGVVFFLFSTWPLLLLHKRGCLFSPVAFSWMALIFLCVCIAALATLGGGIVEPYPRHTYCTEQNFAMVGAAALWLLIYPNLWPPRPKRWLSAAGAASLLLWGGLGLIYMAGVKDGAKAAWDRQRTTHWAQSCLQYYPALDDHPMHVFP